MKTLHASAVLVGAGAVLIRGPSGSGKSRLVFGLLEAAACGRLRFARLVADDRVLVTAAGGRILVSAPSPLAGLLEIRGLGIRRLDYEPRAVVAWVVDLEAEDGDRLPAPPSCTTEISGILLPRIPVKRGQDPLPVVLAALTSMAAIS